MSSVNHLYNFPQIQDILLKEAYASAEQLKYTDLYYKLIYEIKSVEANLRETHSCLYLKQGIKPYIRQCVFTEKNSVDNHERIQIIWEIGRRYLNANVFKTPEDMQYYYDVADAVSFTDPCRAMRLYAEMRSYTDSWDCLICKDKSEEHQVTFFFLDPEIAYKTTKAETEKNPAIVQNILNEAKKVAEWYQPIHPLLRVLSYCKIAKSEIEMGHKKDAKETLFRAEETKWPHKFNDEKEMLLIADCCISALKIRIEPEVGAQISREVYERIRTVDNIACRIIAITTFLETLNPGHTFPNPIIITPIEEMQLTF